MAGKKENVDPIWNVLMKSVDLGEGTSFRYTFTWDALNVNFRQTMVLWKITGICSNHQLLLGQLRNCQVGRNLSRMLSLGFVTWKDIRRNVWNGFADWQIKQLSNFATALHHALTTIISRKKWEQ